MNTADPLMRAEPSATRAAISVTAPAVDALARPQLRTMAAAFAAVLLVGAAGVLAAPPDVLHWWHRVLGEWIITHGRLPAMDPFASLDTSIPWRVGDWLALVALATVARVDERLPIILAALVGALAVGLAEAAGQRAKAHRPLTLIPACAAAVLIAPVLTPSPRLASIVGFGMLAYHLAPRRSACERARCAPLVVWFAVWANADVLFLGGLTVLWAVAVSRFVRRSRSAARTRAAEAGLVTASWATAACLVNPYGPLAFVEAGRAVLATAGTMSSPDFHSASGLLFAGVALLTAVPFAAGSGRRLRADDLAWWILFTAALWSADLIPAWALLTAPILARRLSLVLRGCRMRVARRRRHPGFQIALASKAMIRGACAFVLATAIAVTAAATRHRTGAADHSVPPHGAVDALAAVGATRVLAYPDWGGYVVHHLTGASIALPPRTRPLPADVQALVSAFRELRTEWPALVDRAAPDAILWPSETAAIEALLLDPEWRLVYRNEVAAALVRGGPLNCAVLGAGEGS